MARGLFLILMTSTHAMTLAGVTATSPLTQWGVPRGWATTGLIMLCGFMLATFAREKEERGRIRRRVLRRAKQVLLVMVVSNALMVTIKHVMADETQPLFTVAWWSEFLFFRAEWSISGVLLPIGLFLLVSPMLIAVYDRCRSRLHAVAFAVVMLLVAATAWSVSSLVPDSLPHHHLLNIMFGAGAGGFPVVPMAASGGLGFLVGILWQPPRERLDTTMALGVILFFVSATQLMNAAPSLLGPLLARTLVDVSHLLIIITLAIALTHWQPAKRALRFIPLLGRYSLFTFLIHRIVEQMVTLSLRPLVLPSELLYLLCFCAGVVGSVELILWRRMWAAWDRLLGALYL